MPELSFKKAISILDKMLEGKSRKETIYELKLNPNDVTEARRMFPLFLGLPRKYKKD